MEQSKPNAKKKTKTKKNIEFIIVEENESNSKTLKALKKRRRCKKGTKKYKPLGTSCFTQEEINNYKRSKFINLKRKKEKKIPFEFVIEDVPEEIIDLDADLKLKPEKTIEIKLLGKKKVKKMNLKTPIEFEIMEEKKRYNEDFIDLMEQLSNIMLKQGEPFRSRAYQKAQETIMAYQDDIFSPTQLNGLPGIGTTIMDKLNEYVETGTLKVLEREKTNPINILGEVYGIGPIKAKELVDAGVKTIDDLRSRQNELLNDIQRVGLKYYDDILQRIPRLEIEEYEKIFETTFAKVSAGSTNAKFEIVGSYRRGAQTSGDIDVIITGQSGSIYKAFVDELLKTGIILEVLSRGQSKTLVITRLPSSEGIDRVARRVDFLYAPPDEFAFAILYFTGSKIFNTVMRQYAVNKGYTFNEHGIYNLVNKKKGAKVEQTFETEKDIFDFLGLQFKTPTQRQDGRAVIAYTDVGKIAADVPGDVITAPTSMKATVEEEETFEIIPVKKKKILKKKNIEPKGNPKVEFVIADDEDVISPDDEDIISIIEDFKHNGITVLESLNEKQLTNIIRFANAKYYNQTQIMSDNQFDIVKEFIELNYPTNAVIKEIGAEVDRNKVKLPYLLPSMDKIKPDTNALSKWLRKYNGPYVLSCKLDGMSALYTNFDSKPKLYTRGNGEFGKDISHLIPFLRLPKTKEIAIRGEIIIPKLVFEEKYKSTFSNIRNAVSGMVNRKYISDSIVDLHFVAYEVIVPELIPSAQMDYLATINVERVLYRLTNTLSNELLSDILIDWRKSYMYEIDGIIVVNDQIYPRKLESPDHAFAFKMVLTDQIAEAKVVDVIWTPSKDGYLKPRVKIQPLHLGGVIITHATGFNGAYIKDNNIGIGTVIEIIRSGDVIPYIRSVVVPADEPKMPSVPYKWNDTHVDIMIENTLEDPTVKQKNITGFFRGIEVEGLSSGNITRLIKAGYDTVAKIISMDVKDFLKVEGFKNRLANKMYTGIHSKLEEASISTLMAASNIFGRGFGNKKIDLVMNEIPDILISDATDNEKIADITVIKGMELKTAKAFVNKIGDFKAFLEECGLEDKLYETAKAPIVDNSHPLFGKTVVLTGNRDKTIIDFLEEVGAKQGSVVSKNTSLVVAKDKTINKGKVAEAENLNIPLMSVEEFIQTYIH